MIGNARHPAIRLRPRPRILIVEDTLLIAMFIGEIAQSCGCDVAGTSYTLQEAREALGRHNYDAVLLDIGLQTDLTFEIADVLLERKVPFAFLTAYQDIAEPRHQKVPVLLKPFSTDALIRTILDLVGLDEANRALSIAR
jgi:CheY-like chemotaxis protein